MTQPIRIALIGAGVFARDAHVPAILSLGNTYRIVAIYSRSLPNAEALAARLPYPAEATSDLDALLARTDIDALDVLLPIDVQVPVLEAALASGRHVISEKPIAPDVATARQLVNSYNGDTVWMVGENYRYEPTYTHAAELLREGRIGQPLLVTLAHHIPFTPDVKYYASGWRIGGDFPGGLLLDGGVHHIATLRLLLGEIVQVSAFARLNTPGLKPFDTLTASLLFESGVQGSYNITYSAGAFRASDFSIYGDRGVLRPGRGVIDIVTTGGTERIATPVIGSIDAELAAFAAAVRDGVPHRNSPAEALRDLAVLEALLTAAQTGQSVPVSIN